MGRLAKRAKGHPKCKAPAPEADAVGSCPNCAEETSPMDAFCPKCGTLLSEEE